jgi:hypothetical protein
MEPMLHHSDFYGKRDAEIRAPAFDNWRLQGNARIELFRSVWFFAEWPRNRLLGQNRSDPPVPDWREVDDNRPECPSGSSRLAFGARPLMRYRV